MRTETSMETQAIGDQLRRVRELLDLVRSVDLQVVRELLASVGEVLRLLKQLTDSSPSLLARLKALSEIHDDAAGDVTTEVMTAGGEPGTVELQMVRWLELARLLTEILRMVGNQRG